MESGQKIINLQIMTEKEQLLQTLDNEFATTLRVLHAFPADQGAFKPHERSRAAIELLSTFIGEEAILRDVIDGEVDFTKESLWVMPADWADGISRLEAGHAQTMDKLKNIPDEDFGKMISFAGHDMRRIDALWGMLLDIIHHRGQLSVYIRMAGGKVPAIYGPSADSAE
jgi:hypothetical protein